jgi:hypothetical protein
VTTRKDRANGESYLSHWEAAVSLLALLVAIGSLAMSLRTEQLSSSPNIQIQKVDGGRNYEHTDQIDKVEIECTVALKNVGNAATQIVDVLWETSSIISDSNSISNGWLAVSDEFDPNASQYADYFQFIKFSPVEGIKEKIIAAGETKTLRLVFQAEFKSRPDASLAQNVRVKFTFSNGQQLTVLPQLRYFGDSGTW